MLRSLVNLHYKFASGLSYFNDTPKMTSKTIYKIIDVCIKAWFL